MSTLIDGKAQAQVERDQLTMRVAAHLAAGRAAPGLATILVGDNPASHVYVRNKRKQAGEVGITSFHHELPATTTTTELLLLIQALNHNDAVHGILVQLPLPSHIDEAAVLVAVSPTKDVDGFHPDNVARLSLGLPGFVPCTPLGCLRLLQAHQVPMAGAHAVVVGRINIVGKPMAHLLLQQHATVTIAHSKTTDLARIVQMADIVVAAVGRPLLLTAAHIRPGAVVIDVGINRNAAGKLVGDVDFDAVAPIAKAITPVPGGVGPMTIAMLLANTVTSYERSLQGS
jgi:methylenetetrahydrofolate dehydrogenase (NADP+) / methenyltetrahydrofolate cyclohydrolase